MVWVWGCIAIMLFLVLLFIDPQHPFSIGGSSILFHNDRLYVLDAADWISNSKVRSYNLAEEPLHEFSCAVGAIDMKYYHTTNDNSDNTIIPANSLVCYPNPCKDHISFSVNNSKNTASEIAIYNVKGQLVHKTKYPRSEWNTNNDNGTPCASGVYFVRALSAKQIIAQKIITIVH